MALIKTLTVDDITGEYWMIVQRNRNRGSHPDCVVELCLFLDKAARAKYTPENFRPLPVATVQFNFRDGDHPLSELDPDAINPELISDPHTIETHMIYLHIKAVGAYAASQMLAGATLTPNEQAALFFADAQDDVP